MPSYPDGPRARGGGRISTPRALPATRTRVLVVDDSSINRNGICDILSSSPEVQVVARAADGAEALRLVAEHLPDVITLDLEMPHMDGFTFLRILMTTMPLPVIVISRYSQEHNLSKALQLGAFDFTVKTHRYVDPNRVDVRQELLHKVRLAHLGRRPERLSLPALSPLPLRVPRHLVAVASSTGGPGALLELFAGLPRTFSGALLIAQHMPERFTRTFAQRLDRLGLLRTSEAADGAEIGAGMAFVCPGAQCMEVEPSARGYRLRLRAPDAADRYVPSADRLMQSVARAAGRRAIGVVLTGMADDGVAGARAIVEAGGVVAAESEESAVVYGMPGAVVHAGLARLSLRPAELGGWLSSL
jgi:two-component system, chemotaxis family, protein-glutamate methylesterase/glutaminase